MRVNKNKFFFTILVLLSLNASALAGNKNVVSFFIEKDFPRQLYQRIAYKKVDLGQVEHDKQKAQFRATFFYPNAISYSDREKKPYDIEKAQNNHIQWLFKNRMINTDKEEKKFRELKFTYLSCSSIPECKNSEEYSAAIANIWSFIFYLDDYVDDNPDKEIVKARTQEVVDVLMSLDDRNISIHRNENIKKLLVPLFSLEEDLRILNLDPKFFRDEIKKYFISIINGKNNIVTKVNPKDSISSYRENRREQSGVKPCLEVLMAMNKLNFNQDDLTAKTIKNITLDLMGIGNDIISFKRETKNLGVEEENLVGILYKKNKNLQKAFLEAVDIHNNHVLSLYSTREYLDIQYEKYFHMMSLMIKDALIWQLEHTKRYIGDRDEYNDFLN